MEDVLALVLEPPRSRPSETTMPPPVGGEAQV